MKTIIAGGREITDYELVKQAIRDSKFIITEVVSGKCRGVDRLGERYAKENNLHVEPFPAEWDKYKLAAGSIRNEQMAKYADALIAIWDGKSTGTSNMIDWARHYKLTVFVKRLDGVITF